MAERPTFKPADVAEVARVMASLAGHGQRVGRALLAPPKVPKDRVFALRRAFDATMKDPAFVADYTKRKLPLGPTKGEELQAFIEKVAQTPKSTIAEIKAALAGK